MRAVRNVADAIPSVRSAFNGDVEVLLDLGSLERRDDAMLRDQGATGYILRHESLGSRLRCLEDLLELGYRVDTGIISGLPEQSADSIVRDVLLVSELGVHMYSVSPFMPASNTPLAGERAGDVDLALNSISVLRLCYPHLLIPSVSALERTSEGGQARGLAAGANVMTINFTRTADRKRYLIYGDERFVVNRSHVDGILDQLGMKPRTAAFRQTCALPSGDCAASATRP
ncbi:MAG: biotin synthase [Actinomycetota bacterium]|nr:biotin synthase [Actinomycetota bacterium]